MDLCPFCIAPSIYRTAYFTERGSGLPGDVRMLSIILHPSPSEMICSPSEFLNQTFGRIPFVAIWTPSDATNGDVVHRLLCGVPGTIDTWVGVLSSSGHECVDFVLSVLQLPCISGWACIRGRTDSWRARLVHRLEARSCRAIFLNCYVWRLSQDGASILVDSVLWGWSVFFRVQLLFLDWPSCGFGRKFLGFGEIFFNL